MQALSHRGTCHKCIAAASCSNRRALLNPCRATEQKQQPEAVAQPSTSSSEPVTREFRAFGSKVVESSEKLTGPEDQPDFWEGEKFESLGKALERYFLPTLVVLGIICGGLAARTYEDGASAYIKTPSSPDDEMIIIDKQTVDSVLFGGATPPPLGAPRPAAE